MKAFFTGDLYLESSINEDFMPTELKNTIGECDIVFTNFEGPAPKDSNLSYAPKAGPSIAQNHENISLLTRAGFNLFGLANNHIMDCGIEGLSDTIESIRNNGASMIGAGLSEEDAYSVYRHKGECSVSIIAIAEKTFGCISEADCGFAWMNDYRISELISNEKAVSDYVVVTCHCGAELYDKPLPEVRALYKHFIDLGADAVVGHHPHVCQGIEEYKGKPIFYSLGNFAFDDFGDYPSDIKYIGMVVVLDFYKDGTGIGYDILPVSYEDQKVNIPDKVEFLKWIEDQKAILSDEKKYYEQVNDFCIKMYEEVYEPYILRGCGFYLQNLKSILGSMYKAFTGNLHKDTCLQWHNFAVETNRWIIERALSVRYRSGKK